MSAIRRDVVSVPVRTPAETWDTICEMVSKADSTARAELRAAANVAVGLIAQAATQADPAVFSGNGPQVLIYTLHDDEAIEADLDDEQPLVQYVADGDWTGYLRKEGACYLVDYELPGQMGRLGRPVAPFPVPGPPAVQIRALCRVSGRFPS